MSQSSPSSSGFSKLPRATLQLVPRSVQVRDLLQRHGHNPKLQLMVSPNKSITKVIEHLTGKWSDASSCTPLALAPICLWPRRALSRLKDAYPVTTSAVTHGGLPATVMDLFDDVAAMTMPLVIEYDWHMINDMPFDQFYEECFESPASPPQSSPPPQLGALTSSSPPPSSYNTNGDHDDEQDAPTHAANLTSVHVDENSLGFLELRNFLAGNASQPPVSVAARRGNMSPPRSPQRKALATLPDTNSGEMNFLNDSWFDEKSQAGSDGSSGKRARPLWSPPSSPLKRRHTTDSALDPIVTPAVNALTTHDDIGLSSSSSSSHTSDWLYNFSL